MWDDVWPHVENTLAFLKSFKSFCFKTFFMFDCQSFVGVWIKMSRERSCWNHGFMVTWLVIYVCLYVLHPYRKSKLHKEEVVDYSTDRPLTHLALNFNFLHKKIQLSALFGINWRALSQWACWNMGTVAFQSFHSYVVSKIKTTTHDNPNDLIIIIQRLNG